jgi:hypothetical protein
MTNSLLSDRGAGLAPELLALSPIGGTRRPVKVVEHPSFAPRRLRAEALHAAFTVVRLPVVTLDPVPWTPDRCATPAGPTLRVA